MEIEFIPIGGYGEVGKNMSFLRVGDEAVILDMGLYIPKVVSFEEDGGHKKYAHTNDLIKYGIVPDHRVIEKYKHMVKAIVPSHCHLDHCGAIPYLAPYYNAPIISNPMTIEIIKTMLEDDRIKIPNQLKPLNNNSSIRVSKNIEIELIGITHSTLQTSIVAIHTPKGTVLYANDFKLDNNPVLGQKPNYKRLNQLGEENVIALIMDGLYSTSNTKTPPEIVAREMLKDVMLGTESSDNTIIATTFASHIARLKSIVDFSLKLGRRPIFLGRSLMKYIQASENLGLTNISNHAEIVGYGDMIKKRLNKLKKQKKEKYTIICTGGQGEPKAVLTKMINQTLPFKLEKEDSVIFSNKTIPAEVNIANRAKVEERLMQKKVRIFKDIHVSGHLAREDMRDFIKMVKPKVVIPCQGDNVMFKSFEELALDLGYKANKDVFSLKDGDKVDLSH